MLLFYTFFLIFDNGDKTLNQLNTQCITKSRYHEKILPFKLINFCRFHFFI